ncbi:MAG: NADP-dependent oxidoreductase [Anaerolineae bacterium]|nr:NADP-dependent oxidoreductase [Anaerolineae bacterium]
MKAVRINQWGQPAQVEDIPQPTAGQDEVLVRVYASSLNPVDLFSVAGYLQAMQQLPLTPGTDFSGEVVTVGADVTHVKPGDAVFGMIPIRGGAFAEYAIIKGHEVALKPQSLNYVQASAVPLVSLAAWQTTIDFAQLQKSERVLIHGAGGSVGSVAVQLAKDKGAYIIANDLPEKRGLLEELAVDEIIDAKAQQFKDVVGDVDVVLNYAKADLLEHSYDVLKPGSRYATTFEQPPQEEAERRGIHSFGVFTQPTVEQLTRLAGLIDAGKIQVLVHRTFPMDEALAALEYLQSNSEPGKVVLTMD